jgi:hypothetical protein
MSWRPMVRVANEWAGNGLRFVTREEALQSGQDLMARWMLVEAFRADESEEPANYEFLDGKLRPLNPLGLINAG